MIRPAEHLVLSGALVTDRVCALLNRIRKFDELRAQVRGQDSELDHTLLAIRLTGIKYVERASGGTVSAPLEEPVSQSKRQLKLDDTIGTTEAGALLHMTRRAVSKECKQKRLPATLIGGRYRITREDLAAFIAHRT